MTIAIAAAMVAVYLGVTLAALDRPDESGSTRTEQLSRIAVIAASVTAAAGVTYAIGGWLLAT